MSPRQRLILLATIAGSAMVFLDGTVVNVALPKIGQELPATLVGVLEGQVYVSAGYLATLSALLVLAGALGDHYGRRRMFSLGLIGFTVASVLCGLSPSLEVLILARILQGVAGALLVPGSLAILTATFEGPARGRAIGLWAAATAALNLLGPVLGGILVTTLTWRLAFLINLPIGLVAIWLTVRAVPESRRADAGSLDWLGAAVVGLAVAGLSFGAIRSREQEWHDPLALGILVAGAIAAVAFPFLMARRRDPLVPLGLFRDRRFSAINLSTFLIYGALYTQFVVQSLFLQGALGYTPLAAALVGVPGTLFLILVSAKAGELASRIGARRFLVGGPLLMAVGASVWLLVGASSTAWLASITEPATLVPPVAAVVGPFLAATIFGAGISIVVAPLTTVLMSSVPVDRAGLGSAINNAVSRIGQPLVIAAVFIGVTGSFYATLAAAVPGLDPNDPALHASIQPLNAPPEGTDPAIVVAARAASTDAFHLAIAVSIALLLLGAVVNWWGIRGEGDAHASHAGPTAEGPPSAG
ncbi:MAG TPA: MFS transporter [Candidatus Limnocylindrales bacterium]|nr:MFS transporter [Candidatus Limnocylindrales bacterium]